MKKRLKKVWFICLLVFCFTLLTGLIACAKEPEKPNERKDSYEIALSRKRFSLYIGEEYTLTATVKKNKEVLQDAVVVWTTNAPEIVTVENGTVRAVAEGESVITASYGENLAARCTVVVEHAYDPELRVSVTPNTVNLLLPKDGEGDQITLETVVTLGGEPITEDCQFSWTSQDPSVATVENGKITAVSAGQTTVRLTAVYDGTTAYCDCDVLVENEKEAAALGEVIFFDVSKDENLSVAFSYGEVTKASLPTGEAIPFAQDGETVYLDLSNTSIRGALNVYLETEEINVEVGVVIADGVASTGAELLALEKVATADGYYTLSADVTLTADEWNYNNGFHLLGTLNGTLDGYGYKISTTFTKDDYYKRGKDGDRVNFIKEIGKNATVENVYFDLSIFMPNQSCVFIQNFLGGATVRNCIFNLNFASAGSGWTGTLENRALIGTFLGTLENVLVVYQDEILRLMKDGSPVNERIGAMKNCVFVNANDSQKMGFKVTLDTDKGYILTLQTMKDVWAYETLDQAVSGAFSTTDGTTGYYAGNANVDENGYAVISTQDEHAKTLAEIFEGTSIGVNESGEITLCGKVYE